MSKDIITGNFYDKGTFCFASTVDLMILLQNLNIRIHYNLLYDYLIIAELFLLLRKSKNLLRKCLSLYIEHYKILG